MTTNLDRMISGLESVRNDPQNPQIQISKDEVTRLATERINTARCVGVLKFDDSNNADTSELVEIFKKAHHRAEVLLNIVSSGGSSNKELLEGNKRSLPPGASLSDTEEALEYMKLKMPVYLRVRARYKRRNEDEPAPGEEVPDQVDWTSRTDPMRATNHALLLTGYDNESKIVSYKDPNYGNIEIRITTKQFIEMAGGAMNGDSIRMRSFNKQRNAKLKELQD